MLLNHLEIKNFRSLEDVSLQKLDRLNIIIGRNSSGKSAVFGALAFLNAIVHGQSSHDPKTILTGHDQSRSLQMKLRFQLSPAQRRSLINGIWNMKEALPRRDKAYDSAFFRQVEYAFQSSLGSPHQLHLSELRAMAEDGLWAKIGKTVPQGNRAKAQFKILFGTNLQRLPVVKAGYLNVDNQENLREMDMLPNFVEAMPDGCEDIGTLLSWLGQYLKKAFFFSPFRHSEPQMSVSQNDELSQNGSNLAQVLHTINSNNRALLISIEEFVKSALIDIGALQTPLKQTLTEVGFRFADGNYSVRLHEMGGGVEQLLMIATVLHATSQENVLFIEEPESHLHAGAQRFLLQKLVEDGRQVFITSHSPTFINQSSGASLYQVRMKGNRTQIACCEARDALSDLLVDVGCRNSDMLLSDAVVFVEGPSDCEAFRLWSQALGHDPEENNVTFLVMGGGELSDRKARIRSEVLKGISAKAPVPHLFVLDADERSAAELTGLRNALSNGVHVLQRRELENYLLVPAAIKAALLDKCDRQESAIHELNAMSYKDIAQLLAREAQQHYGVVLLKRIRAEIAGLPGGLFPGHLMQNLMNDARRENLSLVLKQAIEQRFASHLEDLDLPSIVARQRALLDKEWGDLQRRLEITPGAELLDGVFKQFGTHYDKSTDVARIAKNMKAKDIPPELVGLIGRIADLASNNVG